MTTEEDFQAKLDANPEDWQTRLVFADWLQERGDPRAEGYRAMGRLKLRPKNVKAYRSEDWCWFSVSSEGNECNLPDDWHTCLWGGFKCGFWPSTKDLKTRYEAEDAAALAFANLPPARRAELLNPTVPA